MGFDGSNGLDMLRDDIEEVYESPQANEDFRLLRISPHTAVKVMLFIMCSETTEQPPMEDCWIPLTRFLLPFMEPNDICQIGAIASKTCVTILPRRGAADLSRIGDRMVSPIARWLRSSVIEGVVEGIRSGIQTEFYTVDLQHQAAHDV